MKYTSSLLREKYLEFFKTKNHAIIPSASVVPENDPTVLFNTAWMQPLVPYLLWEPHTLWKRLANSQKCIRTWDIDDVWDNTHLTFFEMLWNWSLWDYFKKESIAWSYEFLTSKDWLALDPKMLAVTVFEWDKDAPRDEESADLWFETWIPRDRISYLAKSENWWWPAWLTWPCWPDTEIFYRVWNEEFPPKWSNVENDEKNWMEIWNNVFMEYIKNEKWEFVKASQQNVDTWMWLERITATLNWVKSVYETDLFEEIINEISKSIKVEYNSETQSAIRIIADHSRTATVMMSDWILPSNVDQWYVLRRLIRRSIRQAYKLWFKWLFLWNIVFVVCDKLWKAYPHMLEKKQEIIEDITKEEKQFSETLEKWLKEFDKLINWFEIAFEKTWKKIDVISWDKAFKLYDTYWFPLEMTLELAMEKWLKVDVEWFKKAEEEHQAKSRAWAEQKFKWWLADDSQLTTALHSVTHIMLAWLRKYLWDDVSQKWSNITADRLRFDFNYPDKIEKEILDKVEKYVNDVIEKNCEVLLETMDKQVAKNSWVVWSFWEKYPDIVKVYSFVDKDWNIYSKELCWWPHVKNTAWIWKFKIQKEESSSRGVRRIKAVLIKD